MNLLIPLLKGFSVSGGLIVAIGAQNALVLKQGLRGQSVFLTACTCSLIDAVLMVLGAVGLGYMIESYPLFIVITKYFAILFLLFYGLCSFRSAFQTRKLESSQKTGSVLPMLLAISLLNPHVYLDTVILLGGIASQMFGLEKVLFVIGAISASFSWFFSISYGARLLEPLFKSAKAWKIMDCLIGIVMFGIAGMLIF